MASLHSNSRLIPVLRHLYKHVPAGIEKRCVTSLSGTATRVNTPAYFVSERIIPNLLLKSSKGVRETNSSKQSQNVNTSLLEACSTLNSLSIVQNELIQRKSKTTLNCLPVSNKEIRDNPRIPSLKYDLPKLPGLSLEITTPSRENQVTSLDTPGTNQIEKISPGLEQPMKYANSTTIRMKKKKMKKHKLKRLRRSQWAVLKKIRFKKEAKKKRKLNAELSAIKKEGNDFDAEVFVREKIAKAKRGGYMIDVLETAQADKSIY